MNLATRAISLTAPDVTIGSGGEGLPYHRTLLENTGASGWNNVYRDAVYGIATGSVQVVADDRTINFDWNAGTSSLDPHFQDGDRRARQQRL